MFSWNAWHVMFHSEVSVFGSYNEHVDLTFGVLGWISFVLELVEESSSCILRT